MNYSINKLLSWAFLGSALTGSQLCSMETVVKETVANQENSQIFIEAFNEKSFTFGFFRGKLLRTFALNIDTYSPIAVSPKNDILAIGEKNGTILLMDLKTGNQLDTLQGHSDWVCSLAFNPKGTMLLSGSHDGTAQLWDITDVKRAKLLRKLPKHDDYVKVVGFSPDGTHFFTGACACDDGRVLVWNFETEEFLVLKEQPDTLNPYFHFNDFISKAVFRSNNTIITQSDDGKMKLWNLEQLSENLKGVQKLQTLNTYDCFLAVSPYSNILGLSHDYKKISFYNIDTETELRACIVEDTHTTLGSKGITAAAVSPNGTLCFIGTNNGTVLLLDKESKKQLAIKENSPITSIAFSPDGTTLIIRSKERLSLWNLSRQAAKQPVTKPKNTLNLFELSKKMAKSFYNEQEGSSL